MVKLFDLWNLNKKIINEHEKVRYCHEREIWWCSVGVNVGFEQDGTGQYFDRPVIVIRGFNKNLFFGVALTTKKKSGKFFYSVGEVDSQEATAILSQVRVIDTKRLVRKNGVLDKACFDGLICALQKILFH